MLKLGKKPARLGAVKLRFAKYVNLSRLPSVPLNFGFDQYVPGPWGMLGNDSVGDCVEAGAAHETMAWVGQAKGICLFTDASVISDYSAATGYRPGSPGTDQGTDMVAFARYRQKVGVLDAMGTRHKIGAYVEVQAGNVDEMLTAAWLFGTVGIGVRFPQSAMDQFNAGEPWYVVPGSPIIGGHYIPFIRHRGSSPEVNFVVTWGSKQGVKDGFLRTYCDEAIAYLSQEMLSGGKSVAGFDLDQLQADLAEIQA